MQVDELRPGVHKLEQNVYKTFIKKFAKRVDKMGKMCYNILQKGFNRIRKKGKEIYVQF